MGPVSTTGHSLGSDTARSQCVERTGVDRAVARATPPLTCPARSVRPLNTPCLRTAGTSARSARPLTCDYAWRQMSTSKGNGARARRADSDHDRACASTNPAVQCGFRRAECGCIAIPAGQSRRGPAHAEPRPPLACPARRGRSGERWTLPLRDGAADVAGWPCRFRPAAVNSAVPDVVAAVRCRRAVWAGLPAQADAIVVAVPFGAGLG